MAKKKSELDLPDYFEFTIDDPHSKLVTSCFTKDRRIVIRGLGAFVQVEKGKPKIGYCYPSLGRLADLVRKTPKENDYSFSHKTHTWHVSRRKP